MRDVGSFAEEGRADRGYVGLALEVIRKLSALRTVEDKALSDELIRKLLLAVTSRSGQELSGTLALFEDARVSPQDLTMRYIPEVARRLGRDWEEDRISFTEVTIGTTRLQALLRDVASSWIADDALAGSASTILMVVPMGEQHTLGALVAATWLRKSGVSVCLQFGPSPQDLGRLLQAQKFDAAFISVGSCSRVEACARLVKAIRTLSPHRLPVVIGGAAAATEREDLLSIGADSVTTDLATALDALGLSQAKRRVRTG